MGFFIHKTVKSILDQSKMATSFLVTSACFLLIACNVAAFIFFPKLMAPLAIILSNVITVLLMLVAIRPINRLIQNEFREKALELMEKEKAEKELLEKVATLENQNRELERRIDTWAQTASVPANVNFTFKVETMTFDKTGYIVKEEPLERFVNDPVYKIADKKGVFDRIVKWVDDLTYPGEKKVLYIGKYYIKASIGLDFTKIKFSTDGDVLTLFGVTFTKLNDLAIDRDPGDVNRCLLVSEEWDGLTVNKSDFYQEFIDTYARIREEPLYGRLPFKSCRKIPWNYFLRSHRGLRRYLVLLEGAHEGCTHLPHRIQHVPHGRCAQRLYRCLRHETLKRLKQRRHETSSLHSRPFVPVLSLGTGQHQRLLQRHFHGQRHHAQLPDRFAGDRDAGAFHGGLRVHSAQFYHQV